METSLTRPSKDLLCELWREPAFFGNDARSRANRYIFLADDEKLTHDFARGGTSEPETDTRARPHVEPRDVEPRDVEPQR